jgi:murein DD-endopeptidase MepM/ murein hydrolase activator NlpD
MCAACGITAMMHPHDGRGSEIKPMDVQDSRPKGVGITPTGLEPAYPPEFSCPKLTSLYASWMDVDGTRRTEQHSGVDGGQLGDWILAPASGSVKAAWVADWGWGREGALLLEHDRSDVNLDSGPEIYYSEFDHLRIDEIKRFQVGHRVKRGQRLARVFRPGGSKDYLPEVHWEVWQAAKGGDFEWSTNKHGGAFWTDNSAELIDPLYMLALESPLSTDSSVLIRPFDPAVDYRHHRGFTYIFQCVHRKTDRRPR